jgi:hypothetical protein
MATEKSNGVTEGLKVNGDAANASHGSTGFQDLEYQRGFGNHFPRMHNHRRWAANFSV